MASTIKTRVNDESVDAFIASIEGEVKRSDSLELLEMYTRLTGQPAKMWGSSMIGFGQYHYKSERSTQEGDWPLAAFSPRRAGLTLYVLSDFADYSELLGSLGKHKTSKACLYINKLADVDLKVLEEIIKVAYQDAKNQLT